MPISPRERNKKMNKSDMIPENKKWVASFGNAISITHRKPENYAKNLTLRYPIKSMLTGEQIRLTLDNFCGNEAVTIHRVTIAPSDETGVFTGECRDVTFGGNPSVTIPAGKSVVSDATDYPISTGDWFSVSFYLADFTEMRSGVIITGPLSGGHFSIGDQTRAVQLPEKTSNKTDCYYFLSTVEVLTHAKAHSIVCFGDSITAQDWPDYFMNYALENGSDSTAIIRRAASGTRILRQYDNIVYDSYGLKGDIRFPHEAPVNGADIIVIQHGINDIIHPVGVEHNKFRPWSDMPTLADLIEGLTYYIKESRALGYRVYLGTLLPIRGWRTDAPFREDLRCKLNDWMRQTDLADGCIDFDRAVRNPDKPESFAEGFDSGDHLHPSRDAYRKMGETAYLALKDDIF